MSQPKPAREVDRLSMVKHLQRRLVPFLPLDTIDQGLARIEAAGTLGDSVPGGRQQFEPVATLNACLFEDPTFFETREMRCLDREATFFERTEGIGPVTETTRYRVEQRVTVRDRDLPEGWLVQLWLPVPRVVPGIQSVRLEVAEPQGLGDYYLPGAGMIYGAPLLVEAGVALPKLRLVFTVERTETHPVLWGNEGLIRAGANDPEGAAAAAWAKEVLEGQSRPTGRALVEAVVERMEEEFQFAVLERVQSPIQLLLAAKAGDVAMHTRFLAAALGSLGVATRIGAAQPLMLADGRSHLHYPGATGYQHLYLEWRDRGARVGGVVDLSYLDRWGHVATEANVSRPDLVARLDEAGRKGRNWLMQNLYPLDLILGGMVPESRVRSFSSAEEHAMPAPVDVELEAMRLP
jgi:hypothetical protein